MQKLNQLHHFFTKTLIYWHEHLNERSLPWKQETDTYKIWLSEIIMQQTRVEQGLPYYIAFTKKYPTIHHLAKASEEEALRLWQGLGYYSRCRNMMKTAKLIVKKYKGVFPNQYEQIMALPGIGKYTASAILSFAFKQPFAVVDGNVYRLLSRFWGITSAIDVTEGQKQFAILANDLLDSDQPDIYNQAIMDYGATVCKPKPDCETCLLATHCVAFNKNLIALLPFKEKIKKVSTRHFHYFILKYNNTIYLQKRTAKDIWQGLYEPYLIESNTYYWKTKEWALLQRFCHQLPQPIFINKQKLTHQVIESYFYEIRLEKPITNEINKNLVLLKDLKNFAFPKTIVSFFYENNYL